jgi:signal peptidase I
MMPRMATRGPARAIVGTVLSVWLVGPGAGAGLVGRYGLMLAWIAAFAAAVVASTLSVWLLVLPLAVWIAAVIRAYPTVRAADRAGARTSVIGIVTAFVLNLAVAIVVRATAVEAFRIPSSAMEPTLVIGDHLVINKFIYGIRIPFTTTKLLEWRKPHRGEVIVFIQPCEPDRDYIKRVIATAGQTVEVRCNVVYVDGKPIESRLIRGEGCTYDDQDETTLRWAERNCSEYVERVDGHEYHTYHDTGRPLRDERLAREGGLLSGDPRDFPLLDRANLPPSCSLQPDGLPVGTHNQKPGEIKVTKEHAGACEPQMHYIVPPGHVFVMGDHRNNSNDSRYWGSVPIENIKGKAFGIWFSVGRAGARWARFGGFQ